MLMHCACTRSHLVTYHNIAYMMRLGANIREAIMEQRFPEFVRELVASHYPDGKIDDWVLFALREAKIGL